MEIYTLYCMCEVCYQLKLILNFNGSVQHNYAYLTYYTMLNYIIHNAMHIANNYACNVITLWSS